MKSIMKEWRDFTITVKVSEEKPKEKIKGGLADGKEESDFDSVQLEKGIAVEFEHTDDRATAKEVAMDHLTEDPEYYTKLAEMEGEN